MGFSSSPVRYGTERITRVSGVMSFLMSSQYWEALPSFTPQIFWQITGRVTVSPAAEKLGRYFISWSHRIGISSYMVCSRTVEALAYCWFRYSPVSWYISRSRSRSA